MVLFTNKNLVFVYFYKRVYKYLYITIYVDPFLYIV